jgi:type IV pilus assembly protein PilM
MFNKQSLGLEISHDGLKMVVLSGKRKSPKLNAFSTHDFPGETVQFSFRELNVTNPSRFVKLVRDTYAKLLTSATRVSLSLPDCLGRVMILNLETRFKNRQEGADLIRWKLKKNFPMDIDSIHLDYQVLRDSETGGMITLVSVISKQILNQYEDLLNESGLEPAHIDFTTFNLYRLFYERLSLSENSAFVTFFGGILSITVFFEGIIEFYRSKEISTGAFDMEKIYREINNTMLVYRNNHPGRVLDELFCAASLADDKNFSTIVSEILGMEPHSLHAGDFVTGKNGVFCNGTTLQNLSPALGAAARSL